MFLELLDWTGRQVQPGKRGVGGEESPADSGSPEPVSETVAANDLRFRQTPFRQQRHSCVTLQRRGKDSAQADHVGSVA